MAAKKHKNKAIAVSSETEKEEAVKSTEEVVEEKETETETDPSVEEAEAVSEDKEAEDEETETEEEAEESVSSDEEKDEVSVSKPKAKKKAKAKKKDRVPAIMLVLIYAVIIAVALYYILPSVFAPSFGYTIDEFNAKLDASEISQRMHSQYTTLTPSFKVVDKNSIKEIWSIKGEISPEDQQKLDARFKPFVKTLAATEELENVLVEANTRINDGKLTRMCIYCTYDDSHMSMMMIHFGAVLQNFFDDVSFNDAVMMVLGSSMGTNADGVYTVKDGIAYRLTADNVGGKLYMKLEILPEKALNESQKKPLETKAATETVSSDPTGSSAS